MTAVDAFFWSLTLLVWPMIILMWLVVALVVAIICTGIYIVIRDTIESRRNAFDPRGRAAFHGADVINISDRHSGNIFLLHPKGPAA